MDGHYQCVLTVKGVAALQLSRIKAGAKPVENTGQRRLAAAASAGQAAESAEEPQITNISASDEDAQEE